MNIPETENLKEKVKSLQGEIYSISRKYRHKIFRFKNIVLFILKTNPCEIFTNILNFEI